MSCSTSPKNGSTTEFEAQAQADGVLDKNGFFVQEDWEFELETLKNPSRVDLENHLNKGPVDHETVLFLKGYLMNSKEIKFTPFDD